MVRQQIDRHQTLSDEAVERLCAVVRPGTARTAADSWAQLDRLEFERRFKQELAAAAAEAGQGSAWAVGMGTAADGATLRLLHCIPAVLVTIAAVADVRAAAGAVTSLAHSDWRVVLVVCTAPADCHSPATHLPIAAHPLLLGWRPPSRAAATARHTAGAAVARARAAGGALGPGDRAFRREPRSCLPVDRWH